MGEESGWVSPEGRDPRVRSSFLMEQIPTTSATGISHLRPTAIFL